MAAILKASSGLALVLFVSAYANLRGQQSRFVCTPIPNHCGYSLNRQRLRCSSCWPRRTPLNDQLLTEDGFDAGTLMTPEKVVDAAIRGLQNDREEIYPGLSEVLKILSRLAPKLALNQIGKIGIPTMTGTE